MERLNYIFGGYRNFLEKISSRRPLKYSKSMTTSFMIIVKNEEKMQNYSPFRAEVLHCPPRGTLCNGPNSEANS
jgi:hypothetical protein